MRVILLHTMRGSRVHQVLSQKSMETMHSSGTRKENERRHGPFWFSVDKNSGGTCATVVPKKGAGGGYAVKQVYRDIRKMGHRHKIILRSDGEPAIKSLFEKVANMRASETLLEQSPLGDSRANGRAERAVQSTEKQVGVLKLATETSLGGFSVMHPCFPWLVCHAADVMTKFKVHTDGSTSWEKLKGLECTGLMLEFASKILYKGSAKVQGGVMEPRWPVGIWLGKRFATEEHIVGTQNGTIIRCGAVKPHPEGQFCRALFDGIRGSPWNPTGKEETAGEAVIEHQGDIPRAPAQVPSVPPVRNFKIIREYVERFGYTPGCTKCQMIVDGDLSQPGLAHNPECRKRIENKMTEDPNLNKKLGSAQKRQEEYQSKIDEVRCKKSKVD